MGNSLVTATITAPLRTGSFALLLGPAGRMFVKTHHTKPYAALHFMSKLSVCFRPCLSQQAVLVVNVWSTSGVFHCRGRERHAYFALQVGCGVMPYHNLCFWRFRCPVIRGWPGVLLRATLSTYSSFMQGIEGDRCRSFRLRCWLGFSPSELCPWWRLLYEEDTTGAA